VSDAEPWRGIPYPTDEDLYRVFRETAVLLIPRTAEFRRRVYFDVTSRGLKGLEVRYRRALRDEKQSAADAGDLKAREYLASIDRLWGRGLRKNLPHWCLAERTLRGRREKAGEPNRRGRPVTGRQSEAERSPYKREWRRRKKTRDG
jgi:hypothetical protein